MRPVGGSRPPDERGALVLDAHGALASDFTRPTRNRALQARITRLQPFEPDYVDGSGTLIDFETSEGPSKRNRGSGRATTDAGPSP